MSERMIKHVVCDCCGRNVRRGVFLPVGWQEVAVSPVYGGEVHCCDYAECKTWMVNFCKENLVMPPEGPDELSTITHVAELSRTTAAIRYLSPDGSTREVRVRKDGWAPGYWPPGIGDLITTEGSVNMRRRPR